MDGLLARYTTDEVESYFRDNPEFLDTKRGYETLTGLILAKAHQQTYGSQAVVGFELENTGRASQDSTRPSLQALFAEGKLIDRDADVCVAYKDADGDWKINRIQVTRVEERGSGDSPYDRLLNLVRKKTMVQSDSLLQLAVLIDETSDLDLAKFSSELHGMRVPYATAYLLSQKGHEPIPNTFICYEVYPDVAMTDDISVQIGQESADAHGSLPKFIQTDNLISGSDGGESQTKAARANRDKNPIATITQVEIIQHIRNHPELLNDKKMHELVIGWLLTQFFAEKEREELSVGFPLRPDLEWKSGGQIPLSVILEQSDYLLEDRDIDILIGKPDIWQRCQVTRFINPHVATRKRRLADLIIKKCRSASVDRNIALVVSVESTPHITEDELRSIRNIPFGRIILIMKASEERGHFTYCQLYPKPVLGKGIRVPLPV